MIVVSYSAAVAPPTSPARVVRAAAPIRIADAGGWTDTWFARFGAVFNIAVRPCAEVAIAVWPAGSGRAPIVLHAADFGDRYAPRLDGAGWERHPLLEAAIASCPPPAGVAVEVTVSCAVPPGAGTGTSAAVTVALVGALARVAGRNLAPDEAARAAHAVEVERLGQQSGVQDQIASACGGINLIEIDDYPHSTRRRLDVPESLLRELAHRLVLVSLGRAHRSSDLHERVIARLTGSGPACDELQALRQAARQAARAAEAGRLDDLGRALVANTEAQRQLHPDLVGRDATRVIELARVHGAAGWKVNGAGGDGGSLTILAPADADAREAMIRAVLRAGPGYRLVPISLDQDGLRVWDEQDGP